MPWQLSDASQQGELLPGRAVHGGGDSCRTAAKVLLDALVVSDLSRDGNRRSLSPRGDHGCRCWGGLLLAAKRQRQYRGFQPVRIELRVIPRRRLSSGVSTPITTRTRLPKLHFYLKILYCGRRTEEKLLKLCCASSCCPFLFLWLQWNTSSAWPTNHVGWVSGPGLHVNTEAE